MKSTAIQTLTLVMLVTLCPAVRAQDDGSDAVDTSAPAVDTSAPAADTSSPVLQGSVSVDAAADPAPAPVLQGSVSVDVPADSAPVLQAETPIYDNSLDGVEPATSSSSSYATANCWGQIIPSGSDRAAVDGTSTSASADCWGTIVGKSSSSSDASSGDEGAPLPQAPLNDAQAEQALTGTNETATWSVGADVSGALGPWTWSWNPGVAWDTQGGRAFTNSFKTGWGTTLGGLQVGVDESAHNGTVDNSGGLFNHVGGDAGEGILGSVEKISSPDNTVQGWATGAAVGFSFGPPVGGHVAQSNTDVFKF